MLHDVGHEKTFGKPEPYQHVEHWTEQSRERCEQVGNGSGPEPERNTDLEVRSDFCLHSRHFFGLAEAVEDDLRTGCGQGPGDAQADPARGARYQRYLARKCV